MSNIPSDLKYAKSHEWLKVAADGTALVGITDYAQSTLGEVTFVQVSAKVGATVKAGDVFGFVESVKAASDLYAPVSGTVLEVNKVFDAQPGTINNSPYGDGWLMKIQVANPAEVSALLDAAGYGAVAG